jgi:hypothetical protein
VTDALTWNAPIVPPVVSIITPAGAVTYLNSTNDALQLAVRVSSPTPSNSLMTVWSQSGGPGLATFSNSNALETVARFSAEGIYSVGFTANNGGNTTIPFTVVVGTVGEITNGLVAWWKMSETSGGIAADSSGNGRNATINGAVFTNFAAGYPPSALHLNGTSSYATFSSPAVTQLTVAAWARANAQGNSAYPRIFNTPGYRLFFRFDNQGNNGFDFATFSTGNGDWFSGENTISTGAWYHVAASYDLSSLINVPLEYVNGMAIASPKVITTPSGTQPSSAGTGYIGNVAALNRAWSGDLSDLRIYNRILSGSEIQVLANAASANYAPSVNAGIDQTIIWPAAVNLAGAVADDGKPTPPGAVTVGWSKISGPGIVTFGNANAVSTTVIFSEAGAYELQLAANDGQATVVGSLAVDVIMQPALLPVLLPGALQLSWPTNSSNWLLQYQTNSASMGLGTSWVPIPGMLTNPFIAPIYPNAGSVFYRLVLTNQ